MDDRGIDKPDRNCLSFCPSFFPRNFLTKGYNSNLSRKVKNYTPKIWGWEEEMFPWKIYINMKLLTNTKAAVARMIIMLF